MLKGALGCSHNLGGFDVASQGVPCLDFLHWSHAAAISVGFAKGIGLGRGQRDAWTALERLFRGGRFFGSGALVRRYATLELAVEGYNLAAASNRAPTPPTIYLFIDEAGRQCFFSIACLTLSMHRLTFANKTCAHYFVCN